MKKQTRFSLFSALFALLIAGFLAACGSGSSVGNASATAIRGVASSQMAQQAATSRINLQSAHAVAGPVPLKVIGIGIALSPSTIKNLTCGTNITETYTATFHFPARNAGGLVKFEYTTNNGRGSTPASLSVHPAQTRAIYTFHWSGPLDPAHTTPGAGGVLVTSPNAFTSKLIAPLGLCIPTSTVPFQVKSISLTASPALTGYRCGSPFTETYMAVFHIVAGSPGGTIVFQYTTNNGRSSSPNVSLPIVAGQTTATFKFTWSGALPADHTAPGIGIVLVSAPNQIESPSAIPIGMCN